jgi:hypothetical protein
MSTLMDQVLPMNDQEIPLTTKTARIQLGLTSKIIFRPKHAYQTIAEQPRNSWLTPMLIISIVAVISLITAGWLKQQAALMGNINLPPDFEYYTPEQQAQFTQATQATQGVAFVYVLPVIGSLLGIWLGWLLVGGLLHFSTTLFGGRGDTATSMNIVAWSSLPFAIRDIVRIIFMIVGRKLIENPGLSGFTPVSESGWVIFLGVVLGFVDLYLIWHIILLIIGVKTTSGLPIGKTIGSVLITMILIIGLQSGAKYLVSTLDSLSITRPFFF